MPLRPVHLLCASLALLCLSADLAEGLICGEVNCPGDAVTCSLKYVFANKPRRKITTVSCFNSFKRIVLKQTYETPVDQPIVLPVVECAGYQCKEGAYNCTTVTTPSINVVPPTETTHLVCRDDEGEVIEERNIVRVISEPEATGAKPPTCEGHTCPKGSRSCTYDTLIQLEPYNKTTHVKCFDIKKKLLADVRLVL